MVRGEDKLLPSRRDFQMPQHEISAVRECDTTARLQIIQDPDALACNGPPNGRGGSTEHVAELGHGDGGRDRRSRTGVEHVKADPAAGDTAAFGADADGVGCVQVGMRTRIGGRAHAANRNQG